MPPNPKPHLPHQHQNLLSHVQSLFSNLNKLFQSPKPKKHPKKSRYHKWNPKPKPTSTTTDNQQSSDLISTVKVTKLKGFSFDVKEQCWMKAKNVKGRDPERWKKDPLGNIVFRKFDNCAGYLCYEFGHIEGGESTLENCQVFPSALNRAKEEKKDSWRPRFINRSSYRQVSGRDMDTIELNTYGDVKYRDKSGKIVDRDLDLIELTAFDSVNHTRDSGGCSIQ